MKFFRLTPLLVLMVLALSCSKEESFEKKKSDTDKEGPLLVKVTMQSVGVSYTSVVTLAYDNNRKLVNVKNKIEGQVDEPFMEQESVYYRNGKGIIERLVDIGNIYDEDRNLLLRDSVVLDLYLTGIEQYLYGIRTSLNTSGAKVKDSIIYTYNSKGRIAQVKILRKNPYSNEYADEQITAYAYDDKDNITIMTIQFAVNGQDPPQVINFSYNDKLSPMNFGDEAFLNGFVMDGFNSPHCLIGINDLTEPDNSWNMSYEYNDLNKPVKGVYNNPVTQEKINYSYFY